MDDVLYLGADRPVLPRRPARPEGGGPAVSAENLVGLVASVLLLGYLMVALLFPERF